MSARPDTALLAEVLDEYSAITRTWMGRYLEAREPKEYLYDLASDYPLRAGRGMRPTLCMANAVAVGGLANQAILTAVAIELMHNATLVHDDIEDESELRRGKPTLNETHGTALAINAGDLLMTLAMQPLLDNVTQLGPTLALEVLKEFNNVARETAEGQALELGWRHHNVTDLQACDYHQMVFKKTSWLTIIHPLRTGALVGSGGRRDLAPFVRLGFFIGSAFQIQDDVLNLTGDSDAYGKEMAGDIGEGKRTLMLIHLFENLSTLEQKRLTQILGLPRPERMAEADWVLKKMRTHGSIDFARDVANAHAGAAKHEFSRAYAEVPNSRERRFVENLIYWVIERS